MSKVPESGTGELNFFNINLTDPCYVDCENNDSFGQIDLLTTVHNVESTFSRNDLDAVKLTYLWIDIL